MIAIMLVEILIIFYKNTLLLFIYYIFSEENVDFDEALFEDLDGLEIDEEE